MLEGYETPHVKTIMWCVLSADCEIDCDGINVHPFEYLDEEYILCVATE